MKTRIIHIVALGLTTLLGVAQAATFTVTTASSDGAGSFSQAIRSVNASGDPANTINFNISPTGATIHYIVPPTNGFPLIVKDNTTINGYSQTGSSPNTAAITDPNTAQIKIVLDARTGATAPIYRDMAYCFFGAWNTNMPGQDPLIDNSSMAGNVPLQGPPATGFERGGFTPDTEVPYVIGERAILGIYRATNVTIQGLSFLGEGISGNSHYSLAVAHDFGLNTNIQERLTYDAGSSRKAHVNGCWFGIDPADPLGIRFGSDAGIAAFRHRDKDGLTATTRRPAVATDPNDEGVPNEEFYVGVKPGTGTTPALARAQFNVFDGQDAVLAMEPVRLHASGNQALSVNNIWTDVGRYWDSQPWVFGTDGDGVGDADEGNLILCIPELYNTRSKLIIFAGNVYNRATDGSILNVVPYAAGDEINLGAGAQVRFGSDFNGVGDAAEANTVYNTDGLIASTAGSTSSQWILMRGNSFEGISTNTPFRVDGAGLGATYAGSNVFNYFMDPLSTYKPTITASPSTVSGTYPAPTTNTARVVIDVYTQDATTPGVVQGKTWLGSYTAPDLSGSFSFPIALTAGIPVTATATYYRSNVTATITSTVRSGNTTTLTVDSGSSYLISILRADTVSGNYTDFAYANGANTQIPGNTAIFTDNNAVSFYRAEVVSGGGQTSLFSAPSTP